MYVCMIIISPHLLRHWLSCVCMECLYEHAYADFWVRKWNVFMSTSTDKRACTHLLLTTMASFNVVMEWRLCARNSTSSLSTHNPFWFSLTTKCQIPLPLLEKRLFVNYLPQWLVSMWWWNEDCVRVTAPAAYRPIVCAKAHAHVSLLLHANVWDRRI